MFHIIGNDYKMTMILLAKHGISFIWPHNYVPCKCLFLSLFESITILLWLECFSIFISVLKNAQF